MNKTKAACFECGTPAQHAHHVVPQLRGGTNTVPLCVGCHGKAHAMKMTCSALTRAALQHKKSRGERVGQIPFGHRLSSDGVNLEADPVEQGTLCEMKMLRKKGASYRTIAEQLNAHAVPARGKQWHLTTVFRLLRAA